MGGGVVSVFAEYPDNDRLSVWGYNNLGQLALGHTKEQRTPYTHDIAYERLFLCGGDYAGHTYSYHTHAALLMPDGRLMMTGHNHDYQCFSDPVTNSTLTEWTPTSFYERGIKEVYLGRGATTHSSYSIIIMHDGRVYGAGYNGHLQLQGQFKTNHHTPYRTMHRLC